MGVVAGTGEAELLVEGVVDTELLLTEPLLTELLLVEPQGAGLTLKGRLLPELRLGDTTTHGGLSTMVIVVVTGEVTGGGLTDGGHLGRGLEVALLKEAGVGLLLEGEAGFLGGTGAGLLRLPDEPESEGLGGMGAGLGAVLFLGGVQTGVGVLPGVLLGAGPGLLGGPEEDWAVTLEEVDEVTLLLLVVVTVVEEAVVLLLLLPLLLVVAAAAAADR